MDEMTNKLMNILLMVTDLLKFAEAKNAVLLGFSGAGLTATITYLSAAQDVPKAIQGGILITTFLLGICSLICALSFLPRTNLEFIVWRIGNPRKTKGIPSDSDSFYFFGHLLKYTDTELLDALNRLYFGSSIQEITKKEYLDLANQVITISKITYLKFEFFSWALYLLIAAIFSVPIFLLADLLT